MVVDNESRFICYFLVTLSQIIILKEDLWTYLRSVMRLHVRMK